MDIKTAEFVSPKHPDKICDQIADSILDAYLMKDKYSRTAIEVMGGHNLIIVLGEVKSSVNIKKIPIMKIIKSFIGDKFDIQIHLEEQSPEISKGVDIGGAGDQGIMIAYACNRKQKIICH